MGVSCRSRDAAEHTIKHRDRSPLEGDFADHAPGDCALTILNTQLTRSEGAIGRDLNAPLTQSKRAVGAVRASHVAQAAPAFRDARETRPVVLPATTARGCHEAPVPPVPMRCADGHHTIVRHAGRALVLSCAIAHDRGAQRSFFTCNPHSRCVAASHHQRAARSCSPGLSGRVHGWQPIETNP